MREINDGLISTSKCLLDILCRAVAEFGPDDFRRRAPQEALLCTSDGARFSSNSSRRSVAASRSASITPPRHRPVDVRGQQRRRARRECLRVPSRENPQGSDLQTCRPPDSRDPGKEFVTHPAQSQTAPPAAHHRRPQSPSAPHPRAPRTVITPVCARRRAALSRRSRLHCRSSLA